MNRFAGLAVCKAELALFGYCILFPIIAVALMVVVPMLGK